MTKIRSNTQQPQLNLGIMVRLYYWSYFYDPSNSVHIPALYVGDNLVELANGYLEDLKHIEEWFYINELEPENDT